MTAKSLRMASAALVAALAPGLAWAQTCTPDARAVVDAAYRQVLERPSNGEGGSWVTQLNAGQLSVRELVRSIAKSPEHIRRFMPGRSLTTDVTFAYKHLLGRAPDAEGLKAHERVQSTENAGAVVDSLIDSFEYQQSFSDDAVPGSRVRFCGPGGAGGATSRMRFPGMDTNRNGAIERGEWNGTAASFNVHDWNADGVLSGEEVRVGGRRAARAQAQNDFDPTGPATWTARNFVVLDRNRDNRISSNEWYYSPEYFRRADRDRNGFLTAAEFTGSAWDDDRDDRFENLDVNNNGRVEASEWHGSRDAFEWLDRNRDNFLTRAEVVGDTATSNPANAFDTFQSLDVNRNGSLDYSEWQWSLRSFERYDTNNDDRLTRQEFTAGGGAPSAAR